MGVVSEQDGVGITDVPIICSIVEHNGSYGREEDLLEIQGLETEEERKTFSGAIGGFTAEEVFERIKKHYNE